MRFEKCLTCPSIKEKRCTGPKFMRAPTKDIVAWLFVYMKSHGITNAMLAAASGVPKGTIDGLKNRDDVRHETFVPLLKAVIELTGGVWDDEVCPLDYANDHTAECQQEILDLTQELEHTKALLAQTTREKTERTRAIYALFGLCAGLVVLSLLLFLGLHL